MCLRSLWKFIAAALRMMLCMSPSRPQSLLRFRRCSAFRCPIPGSMAARRFLSTWIWVCSRLSPWPRKPWSVNKCSGILGLIVLICSKHTLRVCPYSPIISCQCEDLVLSRDVWNGINYCFIIIVN